MTRLVNRREFLSVVAATPLAMKGAPNRQIPIIDTHIHMFDKTRPQGAYWPPKDDLVPGQSALPARYREVMRPYPVVGAIAVEASPWLEDNQWVLDQAAKDAIIVGHVGFLYPGSSEFGRNLERFRKNRLYLGIRYNNRENRPGFNPAEAIDNSRFISDLKLLADASLSLDLMMTPDPTVLLHLTDKVPALRLIVPHLPNARMPENREALDAYLASLRQLAARPHVYMKLTEVIKRVNGAASTDLGRYRERLDLLWDVFGEDRIMFGSDWPNSEHIGQIADVMAVAHEYIASKGAAAAEKVYWRNSIAAYRWKRRDAAQPRA